MKSPERNIPSLDFPRQGRDSTVVVNRRIIKLVSDRAINGWYHFPKVLVFSEGMLRKSKKKPKNMRGKVTRMTKIGVATNRGTNRSYHDFSSKVSRGTRTIIKVYFSKSFCQMQHSGVYYVHLLFKLF